MKESGCPWSGLREYQNLQADLRDCDLRLSTKFNPRPRRPVLLVLLAQQEQFCVE
jgi:hypothetical protein